MLEREDTIRRALAAIRDVGGTIDVETFGRAVFKSSKAKPAGLRSAAAGMLGRLQSHNFVERIGTGIYRLKERGRAVLDGPPWASQPPPRQAVPAAHLVPVWTPQGWQWAASPPAATPAAPPPVGYFAPPPQQQPPSVDAMAMMQQTFELFQQVQAWVQQQEPQPAIPQPQPPAVQAMPQSADPMAVMHQMFRVFQQMQASATPPVQPPPGNPNGAWGR